MKTLITLLSITVFASLLVGCGDSSSTEPGADPGKIVTSPQGAADMAKNGGQSKAGGAKAPDINK